MAAGRHVLPSSREAQAPEAAATRIDECRDEAYERAFCFQPKTPTISFAAVANFLLSNSSFGSIAALFRLDRMLADRS